MHIAFLTPEYEGADQSTGGLGVYIRKVAQELVARDHRVSVFLQAHANRLWQDDGVTIISVERARPVVGTGRLGAVGWLAPAFRQWRSARRVARAVWARHAREGIDIIQTASFMAPGLGVTSNGRIPVICRASSYTPLWRAAQGKPRTPSQFFSDGLELAQYRSADALYAPSEFLAGMLKRLEGLHVEVLKTPLPGASAEDERVLDSSLARGRYVLHAGALCPLKGTDLLASAMRPLMQRDPALRLVLAGRDLGASEGRPMIDVVHDALGDCASRLVVLPFLTRAQLIPVIRQALCMALPFRMDNYSNVCLEALACSVPVVGSRQVGLEELVDEGVTGYLCGQEDIRGLGAALERVVFMDEATRRTMRDAIGRRVALMRGEDRTGQLLAYFTDVRERFSRREGAG